MTSASREYLLRICSSVVICAAAVGQLNGTDRDAERPLEGSMAAETMELPDGFRYQVANLLAYLGSREQVPLP